MSGLALRRAAQADAPRAAALINSAYRGEVSRQGWTTEADLLAGKRTDEADLQALLDAPDSVLLLCTQGDDLLATVHLQRKQDTAWLGMLAVKPDRQGQGIGKHLLRYAEDFARMEWHCARIMMSVVTLRPELIAYYERRGYRRTGKHEAFPVNPVLWTPKVEGLQMELLEKHLV
jgi:GNAT superfamily N-acetyltransferase